MMWYKAARDCQEGRMKSFPILTAAGVMLVMGQCAHAQQQDPWQTFGTVLNRVANDMEQANLTGQALASDEATLRQSFPAVVQSVNAAKKALADKDKEIAQLQKQVSDDAVKYNEAIKRPNQFVAELNAKDAEINRLNTRLAQGAQMCLQPAHGPMSTPQNGRQR